MDLWRATTAMAAIVVIAIMPKMAAMRSPKTYLTRLRFFNISSITYKVGLSCQGHCKSTGTHSTGIVLVLRM